MTARSQNLIQRKSGEWWTRLDEEDGLSRSLDFGSDGYTASLNMGHELLQITAPDSRYGIVHARGSYADNPDAILARAQRSTGGKSTFGLKWLGGNQHTYRRTRIEYHGLLNFRWPYKRHTLYCPGTTLGTVSSLSFVKDEMVYQILRFEPGKPIPPPPPPIVPGSERLASRAPPPPPPPFLPKPWPPATSGLPPKPWDYNVEIKIGGVVRLNPNPYSGGDSTHAVEYKDKAMSYLQDKVMSDLVPHEVLRLNFELFINGQKEELSLESLPPRSDSGEVDMVVDKAFRLDPGKPTVIVGRTALGSAFHSSFNNPLPTNDELAEYLGATATSENATDRVWGSRIDLNADIDDDDFCTSAACLEQIMGVTSVPMRRYWKIPPRRPSSGHSSNTSVGHEAETSQKVDKVDRPSSGENIVETRLDNIEKGDKDTEAPSGDRDLKDTSKAPEFTISDSQKLSANGESTALTSKTRVIAEIEPHIAGSNGPIFSSTSNFTENAFVVNQTRVDPAQSPVPEADLASLNNVSSRALSERGMGNDIASLDLSSSPPEGKLLAMGDPNMGIALLAGILCNQWVDVQRSFWQIRYLVKAYHFLATRESRSDGPPEVHRSSSTLEESTSFEKVRTSYLNRIKFHIHHSLVWIARAPLPSGYHVRPSVTPYSENKTALDIEDSDDDRALYPPIVICNDHEPKLAILLWYRHSCLAQISQHLRTLPAFGEASSDTNLESTCLAEKGRESNGFLKTSSCRLVLRSGRVRR
ncbi:hypothetical protein DL98DRAFT_43469 [Cadophora sp. DSE1049]|nr:hypothetical protein DL98DRAFT_43469 [Cadophora sp. DSE1049]